MVALVNDDVVVFAVLRHALQNAVYVNAAFMRFELEVKRVRASQVDALIVELLVNVPCTLHCPAEHPLPHLRYLQLEPLALLSCVDHFKT